MPVNWFVSSHGNVEHKKAKRIFNPGAKTFTVPTGIEIIMYCPGDRGLAMSAGWDLWDMLMYGEQGGEQAAYDARYKVFGPNASVTDYYAYIDAGDYNQWDDGTNRGNGHPDKNAYGVWEVGDPSAPVIDLRLHPDGLQLSAIVFEACWTRGGVSRIYWGCCRSHVKHFGKANEGPTKSSGQAPYTPSALR
jgi:hypothetical protein